MVNTVIKQLSYRDIREAKRSSIKARNKRNINELTKNFFTENELMFMWNKFW